MSFYFLTNPVVYLYNNFIKWGWTNGYLKPILAWIIWLLVGTAFYANYDEFGWGKGFYMSVNVGYSIGRYILSKLQYFIVTRFDVGWGDLEEPKIMSKLFSTIYILVGASAISGRTSI